MGAWRERPSEWPLGMPDPGEERWAGWAEHWLSANAAPHWLTRAALEQDVRPQDLARLAWRLRSAEAAALEASAPWLIQAMVDAGVPPADVAEISRVGASDIGRRQVRVAELEVIGGLMWEGAPGRGR